MKYSVVAVFPWNPNWQRSKKKAYLRIPQKKKFWLVARLLFLKNVFAVLDFKDKELQHRVFQNCSKKSQFCGILNKVCGIRNNICGTGNSLWDPQKKNNT